MTRLLDLMKKDSLSTNEKVELFRGINHSDSKLNNLVEAHSEAERDLEEAERALEKAKIRMDSIRERIVVFNTENKMLNIFDMGNTTSDSNNEESSYREDSTISKANELEMSKIIGMGLSKKIMAVIGEECKVFMNKSGSIIYTDGRFTITVESLEINREIVLYDKEMSIAKRVQHHYKASSADQEFAKLSSSNAEFINRAKSFLADYTIAGWKLLYSDEEGA